MRWKDGTSFEPAATSNRLGGTVHGPAVQAGRIDVLNIQVPTVGVTTVPLQLPPDSRAFTDRDRDRERLSLMLRRPDGDDTDDAAGTGPVVVGLHGATGIGKTALAVRWLREQRDRFPDGLLYARFNAGGPAQVRNPDSVLAGFLLALGVAHHALPGEPEQRTALYRTLTADRALAVLLDDVGDAEHVTPLVPSGPGCVLVVTSRRPLGRLIEHGARLHQVSALDQDHGLALFRGITGPDRVHADRQAAVTLVALCGGRPLTIAVLAATATLHPNVPLADLTAELTDNPLNPFDRQGDNLVQRAVTADYDGLAPLGRELFRLIGVQPVSRLSFPMLLALIAPSLEHPVPVEDPAVEGPAVADGDRPEPVGRSSARRAGRLRRVLDDLVTAHLLVHHPDGNPSSAPDPAAPSGTTGPVWDIDAVQHHVARDLAETLDPAEVRLAAVVRVVDLVLWPALHAADRAVTPYRRRTPYPGTPEGHPAGEPVVFADRTAALVWLGRNVDTVAAYARTLHAAGGHRRAWHLIDALWPLWLHRKHYTLRLELDALALRAAHAWGDEAAQAEMFKRLGLVQNSLRAYEEANEALMAALALRLTLRDRWGEADCRSALGLHYRAVGDTDRSSTQFRLAATGYQAVGALREQALTNHNLGALHLDQGQYDLAQVRLSRTLTEFAALPEPDEYNALRARIDLARAHLGLRQFRRARDLAVDAVDGLTRLGNVVEHARALEVLADIAHATDDPSYPHRLTRALALYESVGSPHADRIRERLAATANPATAADHPADGDNDTERP